MITIGNTQQKSLVPEMDHPDSEPFQPMKIISIDNWVRIPGTAAYFRGTIRIGEKAVQIPEPDRLPGEKAEDVDAGEAGDFALIRAEIRLKELLFGENPL